MSPDSIALLAMISMLALVFGAVLRRQGLRIAAIEEAEKRRALIEDLERARRDAGNRVAGSFPPFIH